MYNDKYGSYRSGNWTKFAPGDRYHYTPPYMGGGGNNVVPANSPLRNNLSQRTVPGGYNKSVTRISAPAGNTGRAPVLNMSADGSYTIMNQGKGTSLPGYKPAPPKTGISWGKLASAAAKMGLLGPRLARANPYLNIASIAFDLAYDLYTQDAQWGMTTPAFEGYPMEAFGFHKTCDIGITGTDVRRAGPTTSSPNLSCGTGGVVPAGTYGAPFNVSTLQTWVAFGRRTGPVVARMVLQQQWLRPRPAIAGTIPYLVNAPVYTPIPTGEPAPAVASESQNGPSGSTGTSPLYGTEAITATLGSSGIGWTVDIHVWSPPDGWGRERKGNATARQALALIAKLYDGVTEAKDAVDILYDNLGTKCKGAKSMSDKAYCVWKNINTLNVGAAVADLIGNHYEDKVYGRIFGTVGSNTPFGSMMPGSSPNNTYLGNIKLTG